jgi:hypothetical protein
MNEPASLYRSDFYAWTQQQARCLRCLQSEPVSLPDGVDLANLVEEVESLGRRELVAVTSRIRRILVLLLTVASGAGKKAAPHARADAANLHAEILDARTPSMQTLIDMNELWRAALRVAEAGLGAHEATLRAGLPTACPLAPADFTADDFDFEGSLRRLRDAAVG